MEPDKPLDKNPLSRQQPAIEPPRASFILKNAATEGPILNAETQRKRRETQRRRTLCESLRTSAPSALNLPSLRLNWGIAVQSKELMLIPATPHRIKDAPLFPLSSRRGRRGPGRGGTPLASRNRRRGKAPFLTPRRRESAEERREKEPSANLCALCVKKGFVLVAALPRCVSAVQWGPVHLRGYGLGLRCRTPCDSFMRIRDSSIPRRRGLG